MIHVDQEPDYVPKRAMSWSVVVSVAAILVSIVATIALMGGDVTDNLVVRTRGTARVETDPFLVVTGAERMRAEADERLRSYGWVDRSQGVIHVPLDVAIEAYLGAPR